MLLLLALNAHADSALLLGNSFTFANNLDAALLALLQEGQPSWSDGAAARLAEAGYTFANHLEQVETPGSDWDAALGEAGPTWGWVILQEQSQIPGFPATESYVVESRAAAVSLDGYAAARGAQTVFLMTWAYQTGDETNPDLYPDYLTMQAALAEGYGAYRDATSTTGRPTWVAPVGLVWQAAYQGVVAAGEDPADPTGRFGALYAEDGRHPSPLGTCLAANALYATLTGASPVGLSPCAGVDAADAAWVQGLADAVIFDESLGYSYPWQAEADTGDTAADSGEADSPAGDDSSAPADQPEPKAAESCGCGGAQAGLWSVILAVLAALRKRGRRA